MSGPACRAHRRYRGRLRARRRVRPRRADGRGHRRAPAGQPVGSRGCQGRGPDAAPRDVRLLAHGPGPRGGRGYRLDTQRRARRQHRVCHGPPAERQGRPGGRDRHPPLPDGRGGALGDRRQVANDPGGGPAAPGRSGPAEPREIRRGGLPSAGPQSCRAGFHAIDRGHACWTLAFDGRPTSRRSARPNVAPPTRVQPRISAAGGSREDVRERARSGIGTGPSSGGRASRPAAG